MGKNIIIYVLGFVMILTSCHDLDLNPLSSGSTETWYSSESELKIAVNDLYNMWYWWEEGEDNTDWSDDTVYRETLTELENATVNGQSWMVNLLWIRCYKAIAHANSIINKYQRAIDNGASKANVMQYVAEAHFFRAVAYSRLITRYGDVPLIMDEKDISTASGLDRTDKDTILKLIYDDFDFAASVLPTVYGGEQRVTKGAALAFKSRIALYMGDWSTAAEAAKSVMDSGVYQLHPDYASLFLQSTKSSKEFIYVVPRSIDNNVYMDANIVRNDLIRNAGGWAATDPSWDLLASYTCTDGLPIDKSPLFDSHNPFKNRDPRCCMTIVPFGDNFMGYEYNPSPEAKEIMNYNTGKKEYNNDTRINKQFASFNGLVWKKGIDNSWTENGYRVEPPKIIYRYAETLLTYAEAKIELNEIDQSVLDAMNMVRARAYGVDKGEVDKYPSFISRDQNILRIQLRTERRMEFAKENIRFSDIMRWRYAEIVMKRKNYGMIYPASDCLENIVKKGDWFWAFTPVIDNNGLPDFSKLEAAGKIQTLSQRVWDDRQYLWPIPTTEIQINPNMSQNPGY